MGERSRQHVEHHLHLAAHQVGERRRAAPVGHVGQLGAGHHLEQFARQMHRGADAGRGHVDLARVGLGERDELGHGAGRHRLVHLHHVGGAHQTGDRRDVLEKIERQRFIERGVDGARGRHEQNRVAVRRRIDHRLGGDIAPCPAPVLDHHLLAEMLRQPLRHDPRHHVGGTAGRKRHHPVHRPGRIRIGGARSSGSRQQQTSEAESDQAMSMHPAPPGLPAFRALRGAQSAALSRRIRFGERNTEIILHGRHRP